LFGGGQPHQNKPGGFFVVGYYRTPLFLFLFKQTGVGGSQKKLFPPQNPTATEGPKRHNKTQKPNPNQGDVKTLQKKEWRKNKNTPPPPKTPPNGVWRKGEEGGGGVCGGEKRKGLRVILGSPFPFSQSKKKTRPKQKRKTNKEGGEGQIIGGGKKDIENKKSTFFFFI